MPSLQDSQSSSSVPSVETLGLDMLSPAGTGTCLTNGLEGYYGADDSGSHSFETRE